MNTLANLWHRIKSGVINYVSIIVGAIVTALAAAIFSPEGAAVIATMIADFPGLLVTMGVGAPVATFIGLVLAELYKDYRNRVNIKRALNDEEDRVPVAAVSNGRREEEVLLLY